ncbi:MAG: hypothetical protein M3247_04965 [Thermoproteota archaeon]|nr:hypothetical protein [Thermoproteota archaeon]
MPSSIISHTSAENIVQDILSSNDGIISVSVRDIKGRILAFRFKESFKKAFMAKSQMVDNDYGGTLALAALSVADEVQHIFGKAKGIVTIHTDCKLMLIPLLSFEILVGLVLELGVDADDGSLANNIEKIVSDIATAVDAADDDNNNYGTTK